MDHHNLSWKHTNVADDRRDLPLITKTIGKDAQVKQDFIYNQLLEKIAQLETHETIQRAFQESEARFADIANNSEVWVWEVDASVFSGSNLDY